MAACRATVPLASSMTPSVSLINPSIASHFSPEAFLPIDLNTASNVLIWPLVAEMVFQGRLRSSLLTASITFGSAFAIAFSAKYTS